MITESAVPERLSVLVKQDIFIALPHLDWQVGNCHGKLKAHIVFVPKRP
jgi:hypothetical protein